MIAHDETSFNFAGKRKEKDFHHKDTEKTY